MVLGWVGFESSKSHLTNFSLLSCTIDKTIGLGQALGDCLSIYLKLKPHAGLFLAMVAFWWNAEIGHTMQYQHETSSIYSPI